MGNTIRLNETELRSLVGEIAENLITDMDENAVLSSVAEALYGLGHVRANDGENSVTVELPSGEEAIVFYEVYDNSTIKWMEQPDHDIITEDYEIYVDCVSIDGELELNDRNDVIKKVLEKIVEVNHEFDPYEDYFEEID